MYTYVCINMVLLVKASYILSPIYGSPNYHLIIVFSHILPNLTTFQKIILKKINYDKYSCLSTCTSICTQTQMYDVCMYESQMRIWNTSIRGGNEFVVPYSILKRRGSTICGKIRQVFKFWKQLGF